MKYNERGLNRTQEHKLKWKDVNQTNGNNRIENQRKQKEKKIRENERKRKNMKEHERTRNNIEDK